MAKERTTISVEGDLLRKAKNNALNVSALAEDAIRKKTIPTTKDLPDDAIELSCTQCRTLIDYGYFCEDKKMFLCKECQDNYDMKRCPDDKRGEHFHIRVPGFEGQNTDLREKMQN